jgi:hypothetical protein
MANFPEIVGQKTMVNSESIVIASDQSILPFSLNAVGFQYSANGVNSTVTQLVASATFTGAIESISNQPAFSIILFSDQNATLIVNMFIDAGGTQKCYTKTFSYTANSQFQISNPANGNYFQCILQNTGGSTTTLLNLNTAYGVIDGATLLNNKPQALYEINGAVVDSNIGNASPGTQRMVLATNQPAFPIIEPDITVSGNITTQNLVPAGTATAGSAVEISTINGIDNVSVQVTGTYTGALTLQGTVDGAVWVTFGGVPFLNVNTGIQLATITSALQSIFQTDCAGFTKVRITGLAAITGTAIITLRATMATSLVGLDSSIPAGTNAIGSITNTAFTATPPALTKNTQGAIGFSTQDLKDAGRNITNYFMSAQVVSTAIEALQSLTGYKAGIAVTATTAPAVVTATKTYRVQSIVITYVAIATAGAIQVNLRANTAGVVVIGSPLVQSWLVGGNAVAAGVSETISIDIPDGLEFNAGTGIGITVLGVGATGTASITGYAKISIQGYEY